MIVSELCIYPIKGCGGINLESAELDEFGLKGDRRFMVVDEEGVFLSQRKHHAMCRIHIQREDGFTIASFDGMEDLVIEPSMEANDIPVRIWDDDVVAADMGEMAAIWFSHALGQKTRLVGIGPQYSRNVRIGDTAYSSKMHFGDSCPVLVITKDSLDDLNRRLDRPVPMDRFRPNLVIDGTTPYAEDSWQYIRIGDQMLQFAKKCGRCTVTTIDQQTGEAGPEPLRTLSTYRKDGNKVCFGAYYLPITKGTVRVGDEVSVIR